MLTRKMWVDAIPPAHNVVGEVHPSFPARSAHSSLSPTGAKSQYMSPPKSHPLMTARSEKSASFNIGP